MNISLWIPPEPHLFQDVTDWNAFLRAYVDRLVVDWHSQGPSVFQKAVLQLSHLIENMAHISVCALRIGSETCIRVGADLPAVQAYSEIAQRTGVGVHLVLPPLSEAELDKFPLIDILHKLPPDSTAIANDLGTLAVLHAEFSGRVVAGRLLWKRKRPARFGPEELGLLSRDEINEWRDLARPEWVQLLGVNTVEVDLPPQGLCLSGEKNVAIHVPWSFVSYGRICYIGSLALAPFDKFQVSSPCKKECMRIQHVIEGSSYARELLRKGKGVYCLSESGDYSWLRNSSLSWLIIDLRSGPF